MSDGDGRDMKISELFYSIQGEGKLVGVPSVFVRTSGCNLRCVWCDTPYASWNPEGEEKGVGEILEYIRSHPARHVVLTGGEPMIAPELPELTRRVKELGYHITIETAATVEAEVECDLMSLSPKLSNSTPWERESGRFAKAHENSRRRPEVIRRLMTRAGDYQLKFVVASEGDLAEIDALLAELGDVSAENVLLMPEGTDWGILQGRTPWVSEVCKQRGFRFCPRLHVQLYGNKRGT